MDLLLCDYVKVRKMRTGLGTGTQKVKRTAIDKKLQVCNCTCYRIVSYILSYRINLLKMTVLSVVISTIDDIASIISQCVHGQISQRGAREIL